MTLPNDYKLQDLFIAKQIAELMIDRCIDSKVLKAINETIFQIKQVRNKH